MAYVFAHESLGQRVLFGSGRAAENLTLEVERLGAHRVMLITTPTDRQNSHALADKINVTTFWQDVVQHVPIEKAQSARVAALEGEIDLLVCVGGGSTIGLAKAIALTSGIPIVAVPTTYAGSEATNVWGITESARKTTGVDNNVLPVTVIYDAALTMSLPLELSVSSGLNAIAHCIDSLWAPRADPINAALATEAIQALSLGLRLITKDPGDVDGREKALYGAYLAAVAFASAGSGLHHKICHVLGGTYNLPHAQTHATVLPYVTAFNTPFAADAERRIAAAFGFGSAVAGLNDLRAHLSAPVALSDYGFDNGSISEAAEIILAAVPASNPRPVSLNDLEKLLRAAWSGTTPTSQLFEKEGSR